MIVAVGQRDAAGDDSAGRIFGENICSKNTLRARESVAHQFSRYRSAAGSRAIQRAQAADVIFGQSSLRESRQSVQTILRLTRLHRRADDCRMFETQRMS